MPLTPTAATSASGEVLAQPPDARDDIRPPRDGVALGPPGAGRQEIVRRAGLPDDPARAVEGDGLHRRGAHVQSEREGHAAVLQDAMLRVSRFGRPARGQLRAQMTARQFTACFGLARGLLLCRANVGGDLEMSLPGRAMKARRQVMVYCVRDVITGLLTMLVIMTTLPVTSRAEVGAAATLSVLAPPVERVAAGTTAAGPGVDGMNLAEGDRIKTGPGGQALITFLDGSTVTVLPDGDVTVKQTGSERGKSGIRMLIHAGRVWARVVQAAGRRGPPVPRVQRVHGDSPRRPDRRRARGRRLRVLVAPRRASPHRPERPDRRRGDGRPESARPLRVARHRRALRCERERARSQDLGSRCCRWCACLTVVSPRASSPDRSR